MNKKILIVLNKDKILIKATSVNDNISPTAEKVMEHNLTITGAEQILLMHQAQEGGEWKGVYTTIGSTGVFKFERIS